MHLSGVLRVNCMRRNTIRTDVELCNHLRSPIFSAWPTVLREVQWDWLVLLPTS